MINREIIYERTMTGSVMKIPEGLNAGLDEKLMLKRKLSGVLPVEKTYVDGGGQYWYNISGKQSLDTYCRVKEIGIAFVERLIISICSELEILEWNLIHTNCLMLDPELIFITNSNQEFIFTLYPGNNTSIEIEFQQLMEYLLKKIDHKDVLGVREAYAIYEKTLVDGYSIIDIQQDIIASKHSDQSKTETEDSFVYSSQNERLSWSKEQERPVGRSEEKAIEKTRDPVSESTAEKKESKPNWLKKLAVFLEKTMGISLPQGILKGVGQESQMTKKVRKEKRSRKEETVFDNLVYPQEQIYEPQEEIHPTICLSSFHGAPRGILLYQGAEQMADIQLVAKISRIGHCSEAEVQIDRDTISQMHARIDRDGDSYYIEDLNSTNGTFVNDEPLVYKERRQLKANDIVRFADIRYRFC